MTNGKALAVGETLRSRTNRDPCFLALGLEEISFKPCRKRVKGRNLGVEHVEEAPQP